MLVRRLTRRTQSAVAPYDRMSANLQEWQDSTGVLLGRIAYTGQMLLPSYVGNNFQITAAGAMTIGTSSAQSNIQALILSTVSTNVGLIVKGAASQTANLQEWQNSSGTVLGFVRSDGLIRADAKIQTPTIYGSSATLGTQVNIATAWTFLTNESTNVGIIIKGAASQTANLQEWQDSAGTALS